MVFNTKKDLIEWLEANGFESLDNGNYFLAGVYELHYGEYERPEYKPTRYSDGWSLKGIYFYTKSTLFAPNDGRVNSEFFYF